MSRGGMKREKKTESETDKWRLRQKYRVRRLKLI